MEYLHRVVDTELDELLPELAAISLDGPKGVGKTATATRRADVVFRLDDRSDHEILDADLRQLDHVRRSVDNGARPSRYLLMAVARYLPRRRSTPEPDGSSHCVCAR